jgi:hypothetical protein
VKKSSKKSPKVVHGIKEILETTAQQISVLLANSEIAAQLPKSKRLKYNEFSLVLQFGREFIPAPKPVMIRWGKEKDCYWNALQVMEKHGLTYCEGFAICDASWGTVRHAWCVDDSGSVVDNTWRKPGLAYFGIPFTARFVYKTVGAQGRTSVLENNATLLTKGFPKKAIKPM